MEEQVFLEVTVEFIPTRILDVVPIAPRVFSREERGFFMETWNARNFAEAGICCRSLQAKQSRSVRHAIHGLHYQIRQPQRKPVRVARSEVFDVAVDIRPSSPALGPWVGAVLELRRDA